MKSFKRNQHLFSNFISMWGTPLEFNEWEKPILEVLWTSRDAREAIRANPQLFLQIFQNRTWGGAQVNESASWTDQASVLEAWKRVVDRALQSDNFLENYRGSAHDLMKRAQYKPQFDMIVENWWTISDASVVRMKALIKEYASQYWVNIPNNIRITAGTFQWNPSLSFTHEEKTYHVYNTWSVPSSVQESGDQKTEFDLNTIYTIRTVTTDSDWKPINTPFPKDAEIILLQAKSKWIRLEYNWSRSNGISIIDSNWNSLGMVTVFRNASWKTELITLLKKSTQ